MKRKDLKSILCASALAIAVLGTVLPAEGSEAVPPEPVETQAPEETDPPGDEGDIKPLSDLDIKHTT